MNNSPIRGQTDSFVTSEQVSRLERALLSLQQSSVGSPQAISAIAAIQYQEILRLRAELDAAMGFAEENCDLTVSLGGPGIGLGIAPASVLSTFLGNLHAALQAVAAFLATGDLPGTGRLPRDISRSSDFQFVGAASGSVRLKLNLPQARTLFPQFESEPVERSLRLMLQTVEWVGSNRQVDALEGDVGDERLLRLLLSQVQRVTPSPSGAISRVEFSGRLVEPNTRHVLSRKSLPRIRNAFATVATMATEVVEQGKLRSVDVDSGVFNLRQRPDDQPDLRCIVPREILAQAIGYLVEDSEVVVSGVLEYDNRGRPSVLGVKEIFEVGTGS